MSQVSPPLLISPEALATLMSHTTLNILDATVELPTPRFDMDYRASSGRAGWLQAHIPGAVHADLMEDLADPQATFSFALPPAESLARALAKLGINANSQVVIYDRADGFWAARLWWMLRAVGLHARVLDGGFRAWRAAGLPEHQGDETPRAAETLPLEQRPGFWIDRQGVQSVLAGERPEKLVCALSAALFDGSAPSRYARRGHIPGSHNLPARQLLDEQGRYLENEPLKKAIGLELLTSDEPLVLYCGGGISAAAVALALAKVGRDNVLLYDGSLQEWAADSELPMTTGATPA